MTAQRVRNMFGLQRSGVALLTVLMTLVLISTLAVASQLSSTAGVRALESDLHRTRARWQAEGCVAQMLSALNTEMERSGGSIWNRLDTIAELPLGAGCSLEFDAVGRVRGLSQYDSSGLARLFRATGVENDRSAVLVASLLDWADEDDQPRARGAERDWYQEKRRLGPRNAALRSMDEMKLVRGFESIQFFYDTVTSVLRIDSAQVVLAHAPAPVLLALPGISDLAALQLASISDRLQLIDAVAQQLRAGAMVSAASVTAELTAWDVRVHQRVVGSNEPLRLSYRIGRTKTRVAILEISELR
jgi:general secretion pathway protein K